MTPATSSPFTLTFLPWAVDGPRRVVASEPEWSRLRDLDRQAAASGERPIVLVGCDVFEPWEGGYDDEKTGGVTHVCNECGSWRTMEEMCCGPNAHFPLTTADVLSRIFAAIDDCSHLRFVLPTRYPGRVPDVMPCPREIEFGSVHKDVICFHCGSGKPRPNLSLLLDATTPAEVDAGVPELLREQR